MTLKNETDLRMPIELPYLETERLRLVNFSKDHVNDLFEMRHHIEHHKYTDTLPDENIEATSSYIQKMTEGVRQGKWLIWAIELKTTGELIGTISLWQFDQVKKTAELGFGLKQKAQQKGYMKEALSVVLTYGFQTIGLNEVQAYTEETNTDSIHLLEKMDFVLSDTIQENGYLVDKTFTMRVYRIHSGREADS